MPGDVFQVFLRTSTFEVITGLSFNSLRTRPKFSSAMPLP